MKSSKLDSVIPKFKEKDNIFIETKTPNGEFINNEKEEKYLKIDETYTLQAADEKYKGDIENNIGDECYNYNKIFKIINEILKAINEPYVDIFDYSLKLSKKLIVQKELVELLIDKLAKTNQSFNIEILHLNIDNLTAIGKILSFAFNKYDNNNKIKYYENFIQLVEKAIKNDINIFTDYLIYCSKNKKEPGEIKFTKFFEKQKKKYEIPPEILVILNTYQDVKTLIFDIDILKEEGKYLTSEELKYFELAILNFHWLLNSLRNIKFNFISKKLEKAFFLRKRELFDKFCQSKVKPIDVFYNDISYLNQKSNFSFQLKIYNNAIKTGEFIENFGYEKVLNNETRKEIIQKNFNLFEYIFISFFSLNFYTNKNIKFELVMNNCYNSEFFLGFCDKYYFDWLKSDYHNFHIFDFLLFNNLVNHLKIFNIEFNCLDKRAFQKINNFLYYNNSITHLFISFFSADLTYIPHNLYVIFSESFENFETKLADKELNANFDENTYLFSDYKEIENKILDKLYKDFCINLASFFEIIKSKNNLEEFGLYIDVPINIRNEPKYMNSIYKFILNIIFYISKRKIKKFCLVSPYSVIYPATKLRIDDLFNNINLKKNKYFEELTLQLQFYNIKSITSFLNTRLIILNLGNMDLYTFKCLCIFISNDEFQKASSLQQMTLKLMENINTFTEEIKFLFGKLFEIKIKALFVLNLYTGLCLSDKNQYFDLLKLINYNWIIKYTITFSNSSEYIYKSEANSLFNLKCLIPIFWEKKLLEYKNKQDRKNLKEIDYDVITYLKYLFNKKYKPYEIDNRYKSSSNDKKFDIIQKKMIFDILKYIYIFQIPNISHK